MGLAIKPNHVNYPYIDISFQSKNGGPFSITSDANGKPDMFISLTHERKAEQAALMKLNFSYVPVKGNIRAVEKAIADAGGVCLVSYGHRWQKPVNDNNNFNNFEAMATSYSVSFERGFLNYSMDLVSRSLGDNSATPEPLIIYKNQQPYGAQIESFFQKNNLKYTLDPESDLDFKFNDSLFTPTDNGDQFTIQDESLIGTLKQLVWRMVDTGATSKTQVINQNYYTFEVIDDRDKPRIRIKKVNVSSLSSEISFDWYSKNSEVISWSTEYNGTLPLAASRSGATSQDQKNNLINSTLTVATSSGGINYYKPASGSLNTSGFFTSNFDAMNHYLVYQDSWWKRFGEYPYRAKLEVLGNTKFYEVGKCIEVNALIYNERHNSSGKYMVLGVTDSISSRGFTTEYSLAKIPENTEDEMISKIYSRTGWVRNLPIGSRQELK